MIDSTVRRFTFESFLSMARRGLLWLVAWGPAILVMALIFHLSSQPDFGGPGWASAIARLLLGDHAIFARFPWLLSYLDAYLSWAAHFVEYALLAVAYHWAIRRQWPANRHALLYAWLAAVLYGISDEAHQHFVPNRQPDVRDILTDAAGAAVALTLVWHVEGWVSKRREKREERRAKGEGRQAASPS